MKKLIVSFFIFSIIIIQSYIVKNCDEGMGIIYYINSCVRGQVSSQLNLYADEKFNTNKLKMRYSYRPPKSYYEVEIIAVILGFIVLREYKFNIEGFSL